MYQKNEKAFEHDVNRFMLRNGCEKRQQPYWSSQHITLFQLFLAVRDRGGFHNVQQAPGGWMGVYKEFTGLDKGGHTAKTYYSRNLLPYELYLDGRNYDDILIRKKKRCTQYSNKEDKTPYSETIGKENKDNNYVSGVGGHTGQKQPENSLDIKELLDNIDIWNSQCTFDEKFSNDPDITMYASEATPKTIVKILDTTEEFNNKTQARDAYMQVVPNVPSSYDSNEKLFHELSTMQNALDTFDMEFQTY